MKRIALSGGGFYGLYRYFRCINDIGSIQIGYINGRVERPSYLDLLNRLNGFEESVMFSFDEDAISIRSIVALYIHSINPHELFGRYGIYYYGDENRQELLQYLNQYLCMIPKDVTVVVTPVRNFHPAKEYKQKAVSDDPEIHCPVAKNAFRNISISY